MTDEVTEDIMKEIYGAAWREKQVIDLIKEQDEGEDKKNETEKQDEVDVTEDFEEQPEKEVDDEEIEDDPERDVDLADQPEKEVDDEELEDDGIDV